MSMVSYRKLAAFIKKDFFIHISYRFALFINCVGLISSILTFYFIAKIFGEGVSPYLKEYGGQYFPFVLIGLAFSNYLTVALRTFSMSLREEQLMGTLEAMFLTPTKVTSIIIAMSSWDFIFGTLNAAISLLFGVWFLGVKLANTSILGVLVVFILLVISSSSIGMISAAFIMVFKKGDPISWAINLLSAFFGGVYFPTAILPQGLRFISNFLPITYSLRALRNALLKGYGFPELLPDILILLVFCLVFFPLSLAIFKYTVKRAKINGSLTHY